MRTVFIMSFCVTFPGPFNEALDISCSHLTHRNVESMLDNIETVPRWADG